VGLVHRTVGCSSNLSRPIVEREGVLTLVRDLYGGTAERGPAQRFGPALVTEHLWTDHGLKVPCSTVRDWMSSAGLWSRVRRVQPKPQRRDRRQHFGELVQLYESFHDWFEAVASVDRNNGTQQDRLIKKMRLLGIRDDAGAIAYVESTYLPQHNARFAVPAASPVDYHLPRAPQPADQDVFCLEHTRTVMQFNKQALQVDRSARGRVPAGSRLIIRGRRDGPLRIIHVGRGRTERECRWSPALPVPKTKSVLPTPEAAQPRPRPKPAADHPWRRTGGQISRSPVQSPL
jgi:hypothetical protein